MEYLKALISTIENKLRDDNATDLGGYSWLEGALKDLFVWNRRLWEFCGDTEFALDGLRILPNCEIKAIGEYDRWASCDEDFRYVHRKMTSLKDRMYELITFANGLVALVQAQRSVKEIEASVKAAEASVKATEATRHAAEASTKATNATLVATQESTSATKATLKAAEASEASEKASAEAAKASLTEAKAVRALTVVGMLYLPLTFTSALFSMGQNYGPGQAQFWVYWVVALPAAIFACIVYLVVLKVAFRKPKTPTSPSP
jgi:Mg2+ and Co2+ transporter CorA